MCVVLGQADRSFWHVVVFTSVEHLRQQLPTRSQCPAFEHAMPLLSMCNIYHIPPTPVKTTTCTGMELILNFECNRHPHSWRISRKDLLTWPSWQNSTLPPSSDLSEAQWSKHSVKCSWVQCTMPKSILKVRVLVEVLLIVCE